MKLIERFSINNDCYKENLERKKANVVAFQNNGPKGLMLHSVGCCQPKALVFAEIWNKPNKDVAVHAVLQADGTVYQCLPWNFRGWHAGGYANNTHIGVEMTEPRTITYVSGSKFTIDDGGKDEAVNHVKGCYKTAVELFAKLCIEYSLDPMSDIISHKEGYAKGVASNHGDPEHLWKGLGLSYTMDTFRKAVKNKIEELKNKETSTNKQVIYRVRKSWNDSKSQIGAYKVLANAKTVADDNPGYEVYDPNGVQVYPTRKSNLEIAKEVIRGDWGNGADRKNRLTAAGYDYTKIQSLVNELFAK